MYTLNVSPEKEIGRIIKFFTEEVLIKDNREIALFRPSPIDASYQEVYLYNRKEMEGLPFTTMPIMVTLKDVNYILIDIRQFVSKNSQRLLITSSPGGLQHAIFKMATTVAMQTGNTGIFRGDAALAGTSFVNNLSNIFTRDWNARHEDAMAVRAVTAVYYGSMIPSTKEGVDPERQAMTDISRWAAMPMSAKMDKYARNFLNMDSPEAFIEAIKSVSTSPRLKSSMSYPSVLTSFTKTAYGPSGVIEALSVGMRAPEAYAAVVLYAINNSMTRGTVIGKDLDRFRKKEPHEQMGALKDSLIFDPNDLLG